MFKKFYKNTAGNVALMFAIAAVPLFLAAGMAVDYSRSTRISGMMQVAADAAALAGAALNTTSNAERIAEAKKFYAQNFPDLQTPPEVQIIDNRVVVDASNIGSAIFMSLAGFGDLATSSHAEAIIAGAAKAEVALVLDYSGSMNRDGKYQAMRDSAMVLLDTLMVNDTAGNIKIGLVPFSDYVYSDMLTTYIRDVHADKYGNTVRACLDSRKHPYATESSTPAAAVQDTKWPAPGMPADFKQPGTIAANQSINEQIIDSQDCDQVSADYELTCVAAISPGLGEDDLEDAKDACEDAGDDIKDRDECTRQYNAVEKAAQVQEALQSDFAATNTQCADYRDRNLLVQPLTSDELMLKNQLQVMTPLRMTNIALALEYGWHMVSPNAPYQEGVDYTDPKTLKVVVLLTDGKQTVGGFGPGNSFNIAQANQNTKDLCEAIKVQEILLVSIAFDLANNGITRQLLENCASGPEFFFRADTNADLALAFEQLTAQLKEPVRLVK